MFDYNKNPDTNYWQFRENERKLEEGLEIEVDLNQLIWIIQNSSFDRFQIIRLNNKYLVVKY